MKKREWRPLAHVDRRRLAVGEQCVASCDELCRDRFFFNDTAPTEIYTRKDTLSLHDALPIFDGLYAAIQSASQLRSRRNAARTRHAVRPPSYRSRSESIRTSATDLCTYDPDTDADIGSGTARSDATKWQRQVRSSGSTQKRATASSPSRGGTTS